MAADARTLLDALMGGDRNAPIPRGAALPPPRKKRKALMNNFLNGKDHSKGQHQQQPMRLPGVRKRSCYDPNICPLFCAWGIDVFELFINTKSDIGNNPYIIDVDAHEEFKGLPPPEKERLGYEHMLYRKLQELVRSCDRTVSRNKEKLRLEIQRAMKGMPSDPIMIVDEEGVKRTSELLLALQEGEKDLEVLVKKLDTFTYPNHNFDIPIPDKFIQECHSLTSAVVQKMLELQPLKEQIDTSKRSLYFYRSDTSTDKTVCEVSGNFMSSRDADERIAAHYAGKQYVGWKLVREKYKDLDKKFRNYRGPPRPAPRPHPGPQPRPRDNSNYSHRGGGNYNRPHSPPRRAPFPPYGPPGYHPPRGAFPPPANNLYPPSRDDKHSNQHYRHRRR